MRKWKLLSSRSNENSRSDMKKCVPCSCGKRRRWSNSLFSGEVIAVVNIRPHLVVVVVLPVNAVSASNPDAPRQSIENPQTRKRYLSLSITVYRQCGWMKKAREGLFVRRRPLSIIIASVLGPYPIVLSIYRSIVLSFRHSVVLSFYRSIDLPTYHPPTRCCSPPTHSRESPPAHPSRSPPSSPDSARTPYQTYDSSAPNAA